MNAETLARAPVPTEGGALIDHILARFHEVHRTELPELIRLAKQVEAVHRDHPDAPTGLAQALDELLSELAAHMGKEELILFPMMKNGGNPMIGHPILRMRIEHDEHGNRMRMVESLAHDCTPPADACNTWRSLYSGIAKLIEDLREHIRLENDVLFPQFATDLPKGPICMGFVPK